MLRFGGRQIYIDAMGTGAGSTVSTSKGPCLEQVLLDASGPPQSPAFEGHDGDLRELSSMRTV